MVNYLSLKFEGGEILIVRINESWVRCFLVTDNISLFLGAESQDYVKDKLKSFVKNFDNERNFTDEINGCSVIWVMTLGETHHTLYAGKENELIHLFWQNTVKEIFIIKELIVSIEQVEEWINLLDSISLG
jgi:hypothetical protein